MSKKAPTNSSAIDSMIGSRSRMADCTSCFPRVLVHARAIAKKKWNKTKLITQTHTHTHTHIHKERKIIAAGRSGNKYKIPAHKQLSQNYNWHRIIVTCIHTVVIHSITYCCVQKKIQYQRREWCHWVSIHQCLCYVHHQVLRPPCEFYDLF